mgnify:CR=1 FL=1
MSSRKPSAKAKRVAEFKASLGGLDDAFNREKRKQTKRAIEREHALEAKACTTKKRYAYRSDAEEAIELCAQHGTRGLHCYRCPYCEGWHLTSSHATSSDAATQHIAQMMVTENPAASLTTPHTADATPMPMSLASR